MAKSNLNVYLRDEFGEKSVVKGLKELDIGSLKHPKQFQGKEIIAVEWDYE